MPPELWRDDDPLDQIQRYQRYLQASRRIEDQDNEIEKLRLFAATLLDPEVFGHAVTPEVRDAARVVLGRHRTEVPNAALTGDGPQARRPG